MSWTNIHVYIHEGICEVSTFINKSDLSKTHGVSVRLQEWCMIPISHDKEIFYFSAIKCAIGGNPRDSDHRGMKLATDGVRMTILTGIMFFFNPFACLLLVRKRAPLEVRGPLGGATCDDDNNQSG